MPVPARGAKELQMLLPIFRGAKNFAIKPLYEQDGVSVFKLRAMVGRFMGFKIVR